MKQLIFCLIGFSFLQIANAQPKERSIIIGSVYHDINELQTFNGYKEQEGTVIGNDGLGLSMITKRNYTIILLDKVISNTPIVKYKILDIAVVGNVEPTQMIIISYCRLDKKNRVIALVKKANKGYYNKVLKAWGINLNTKRVERISVKGVPCTDENYTETD